MNYRKILFCLGLFGCVLKAHAEVLVILPESGPMARAGLSIKQGILNAYQSSSTKIPLKFVNSDKQSMATILKQNVNAKTKMVIGPLARSEVEKMIQTAPKIPVLALNEVNTSSKNVWQFSLSKNDDALALIDYIQRDQVKKLYAVRQNGTEAESISFLNALLANFKGDIEPVEHLPKVLDQYEGVLLLGNYQWLSSQKKLPTQHIYTQAFAVEDSQPMPNGIKFCDVPALYIPEWRDVLKAYQQNPTSMPYQRLYAFGGDAWHIAEQFVLNPKVKNLNFSGRTGVIHISTNRVDRVPKCFAAKKKGLVAL